MSSLFPIFFPFSRNQFWYGFYKVDANGKGEFSHAFANGSGIDGDTYCASAILTSDAGTAMYAFTARAGVNAGGSERFVNFSLQRPVEWWKGIAGITFLVKECNKFGIDKKGAGVFLDTVKSIVPDVSKRSTSGF
ncbi:MAG: hypothetical protein JKY96_02705 [Phycisphaerales bacterium]|nr:hypothetical protein [Phycisphaerales bacterium]